MRKFKPYSTPTKALRGLTSVIRRRVKNKRPQIIPPYQFAPLADLARRFNVTDPRHRALCASQILFIEKGKRKLDLEDMPDIVAIRSHLECLQKFVRKHFSKTSPSTASLLEATMYKTILLRVWIERIQARSQSLPTDSAA